MSNETHWKVRLREERIRQNWRQHDLAEQLGVAVLTVQRWERGSHQPSAYFRVKLCSLFGKNAEELGFVAEIVPDTDTTKIEPDPSVETLPSLLFPDLWNVFYPRNLFFTGREEILQQLHERFNREHTIALTQSWAVTGLGGIGKTQIALEYAYRYRQDYRSVFWTNAATQESLQADVLTIAELLQLPERNEQDQKKVLLAVKQWFATHREWLWILDNVDNIEIVQNVLPMQYSGHLLFTSRAQALGIVAQRIEIVTMEMTEGTLFLLHRAKLLALDESLDDVPENLLAATEAIVMEMDFLPLALDQAGAYIEEVGCSLSAYLELFRTHRKKLLQRRGKISIDHPESVATTWSLSFDRIERANPAAADLLRLCAFLEPDTIPEEMLSVASVHFGSILQRTAADAFLLNEAIEELRKFSLVQRSPETQRLRIHRLVQAVLKDSMQTEVKHRWAERAVRAMNIVFPQQVEVTHLPLYRRYLPQIQVGSVLIQDYNLSFTEAASLLFRTAAYLHKANALYEQAEPLLQQALQIQEQASGSDYPDVTQILNSLANLYVMQGKYEQAEPLLQRALQIQRLYVAPDHAVVAQVLNNLGELYTKQGKYELAEPLFEQALQIWKVRLGPDDLHTARVLNNLTFLFRKQGKYELAEPLIRRALQIWEKHLGPDHPDVAFGLKNLAALFEKQGKYEQAEPLFLRALQIREQVLSPNHLSIASSLMGLANLYRKQGKKMQAEPLYERALHIRENGLITQHPDIAETLHDFANLREAQGRIPEALALYKRALAIQEQVFGPEHSITTTTQMKYVRLTSSL